jgi:hypothetical protein
MTSLIKQFMFMCCGVLEVYPVLCLAARPCHTNLPGWYSCVHHPYLVNPVLLGANLCVHTGYIQYILGSCSQGQLETGRTIKMRCSTPYMYTHNICSVLIFVKHYSLQCCGVKCILNLNTVRKEKLKFICCAYFGAKDLTQSKRKVVHPSFPCIMNSIHLYSDMHRQIFVNNLFR